MARLGDRLVVISHWPSEEGNTLVLQDFVANGESFIPIFSDEEHFRKETRGSDFEAQGVSIDRHLLLSLLTGTELLILNPGSTNERLRKADLDYA